MSLSSSGRAKHCARQLLLSPACMDTKHSLNHVHTPVATQHNPMVEMPTSRPSSLLCCMGGGAGRKRQGQGGRWRQSNGAIGSRWPLRLQTLTVALLRPLCVQEPGWDGSPLFLKVFPWLALSPESLGGKAALFAPCLGPSPLQKVALAALGGNLTSTSGGHFCERLLQQPSK